MTRQYLGALALLFVGLCGLSAAGWWRVALPVAVATICLAVWIVGDLLMTELLASDSERRYTGAER